MKYVNKLALQDLINNIQNNSKLAHSRHTQDKVYHDEPIIMTAAQLKSVTPHKYKELEQLAKEHKAANLRKAEAFYYQAKLMEDFTDDYGEKTPQLSEYYYYPTYEVLNLQAQRCYFTWRTQYRAGNHEQAPLTFLFIYIYEILHNIGVESPLEGLQILQSLDAEYGGQDATVSFYLRPWLRDYIIYYNLDMSLLQDDKVGFNREFEQDFSVFLRWDTCSDSELYASLVGLSSYNPANAKAYKKYPCECEQITAAVMHELVSYFATHGKKTLRERCFGGEFDQPVYLFERGIFYDYLARNGYEYVVSPLQKYACRHDEYGTFWHEKKAYYLPQKSRELGDILRTLENALRVHFGITPLLKEVKVLKIVKKIISQAIESYAQWKREEAALAAENERKAKLPQIDVSKLAGIRAAAADTREKLLTEEERGNEVQPMQTAEAVTKPPAVAQNDELPTFALEKESNLFDASNTEQDAKDADGAASSVIPQATSLLSPQEDALMRVLLTGGDADDYAREHKLLLSVVVDSINEKLYDEIGDTVIEFAGDAPVVIEDYLDDVRKILGVK